MACRTLIPWPGIKPVPPVVEGHSLNLWTTRKVPVILDWSIDKLTGCSSLKRQNLLTDGPHFRSWYLDPGVLWRHVSIVSISGVFSWPHQFPRKKLSVCDTSCQLFQVPSQEKGLGEPQNSICRVHSVPMLNACWVQVQYICNSSSSSAWTSSPLPISGETA